MPFRSSGHMGKPLSVILIVLALLLSAATAAMAVVPAVQEGGSATPTIVTDQPDYTPGAIVTLTGVGWQAGEVVRIFVNDDVNQTWSLTADVTADAAGTFVYPFQLPTWFVANYTVTAAGPSGTATTTFTDGPLPASVSLTNWETKNTGMGHWNAWPEQLKLQGRRDGPVPNRDEGECSSDDRESVVRAGVPRLRDQY